jgi:hypothetical protein
MSYLRYGHELHWFNDESTEYVYPCSDDKIEDYGSNYDHLPSLVELIGNIVWRETKDFSYATKIVVILAHKLNISKKLRADKFPHEDILILAGQNHRDELEQWERCFDRLNPGTICDESELFDVEKNMDTMIEEARVAVMGVIEKLDLPCPLTIDASFFRWTGCDGEYEFGVDLRFDEMFTSESSKEENEIRKVEDAIEESGVLKPLEKRVGKIEVCCYVPFNLDDIRLKEP